LADPRFSIVAFGLPAIEAGLLVSLLYQLGVSWGVRASDVAPIGVMNAALLGLSVYYTTHLAKFCYSADAIPLRVLRVRTLVVIGALFAVGLIALSLGAGPHGAGAATWGLIIQLVLIVVARYAVAR
jgi:hypothetical protein